MRKSPRDVGTGGRRRKGRPRIRWKVEVEEDLREMRITRWRTKAKNIIICSKIVLN
jgi:hypothetical protein